MAVTKNPDGADITPGHPATVERLGATKAGVILARSVLKIQFNTTVAEADIGLSISFTCPKDRDVEIFATIPMCGVQTANGILFVRLTDAANVQKDQNSCRPSIAARDHSELTLVELIPANSGPITRKVRAINDATAVTGYGVLGNGGTALLKATVV